MSIYSNSKNVNKSCSITQYQNLVTTSTWNEIWLDKDGIERTISVTGEIWTVAIQSALRNNRKIFIPYRQEPYYIDTPLVLTSGNHLLVDPNTEIRLKPFSNTCMVRNKNIVNGQDEPISLISDPDTDIIIEGGIWTTLAWSQEQSNGNFRGQADGIDSFYGAHGTILLHNVHRVQVRNLTIKHCLPFGIQIGNCSDFLIENIFFKDTRRDGIHLEGPAQQGIIRNIYGITGDDMIALNAWDWKHYSVTFGPITDILVENVRGNSEDCWSTIRLLAGTKNFANGDRLNCDIKDCIFKDIHGIHTFKIYDQPNSELGRDNDFADPIGRLENIYFKDIHVEKPSSEATFQLMANIDRIIINDVVLNFDLDSQAASAFKLVEIGPMSATYKPDKSNPDTWVEVFSPDKDCTVKHFILSGVQSCSGNNKIERRSITDVDKLLHVRDQSVNSDYPNTVPKGGVGKCFFEK